MNMGKNWLIRTRSNHILGPVSKEKVVELHANGSIKADDEVCSGNGYWFFLRETDMVERFLTGDEAQGFNPISEAKDVLTASGPNTRERTSDDITLIGSLNLKAIKDEPKAPPKPAPKAELRVEPAAEDLEEPDLSEVAEAEPTPPKPEPKPEPKKKVKLEAEVKSSPTPRQPKPLPKKQDYLFYLMAIGGLIIIFLLYFRKTILGSFFGPDQVTATPISFIISEAHAQDDGPAKKKSSSIRSSR